MEVFVIAEILKNDIDEIYMKDELGKRDKHVVIDCF